MQHIHFTLFKKSPSQKDWVQETFKAAHRSGSGSEHTATWLRDSAGLSEMNELFVLWNLLQTFVKTDLYNGNLQNLSPTPQINLLA